MTAGRDPQGNRVAIVTGASRGLGRAIAARLREDGYHIVACDIRPPATAAGSDEKPVDARTTFVQIDVADRSAVFDTVRAAAAIGPISVLVNSAIVASYAPLEELTQDTVQRMINVGLLGALWFTQAVIPHMEAAGQSSIINLSSPVAVRSVPGAGVYAAIKGAISSLTIHGAGELGRRGIRVNAVVPGTVATEGARELVDEAGFEARRVRVPLGRLATEGDVANAVSFLVSGASASINGQLITIDGGAHTNAV